MMRRLISRDGGAAPPTGRDLRVSTCRRRRVQEMIRAMMQRLMSNKGSQLKNKTAARKKEKAEAPQRFGVEAAATDCFYIN